MPPPSATYRLQLGPLMSFRDAAALADYLVELGVGALYVSPVLQAAPGSTHGYDVTDPTQPSEALGGEDGWRLLTARLGQRALGLVVDVVPNHMGVGDAPANPWWWDVLREGRGSEYAHFFDVDWDSGPLLLPVLADDGDGEAVALGDLRVEGDCLVYRDHRFPVAPGTGNSDPRRVHERQHYRLVSWRRGNRELNYRRFFDITDLAAVRVEDPVVFAATHATLLRWVEDGAVTGLRIDHPDGLADPGGYVRRLRSSAPDVWLVVEKILGVDEDLPASWPVDGTTGYDALREVCGLFVDCTGEESLTNLYVAECNDLDPRRLSWECRIMVASRVLRAEVRRIAALLPNLDRERTEEAVVAVLASFPVYRSYLPEGRGYFEEAVMTARQARPEFAVEIDAVADAALAVPDGELARRIQQTSGMVMAKGIEDTLLYRYPRLVALNEVGGDLLRFGVEVTEFHQRAAARAAGWPHTMTALSTHDTKRSEDVRARIAVLSELADEFSALVRRWSARCALPEPTLNLLGWQTLLGAWPIGIERLREYLLKAAREAKLGTSWTDRNADFEAAVANWPVEVHEDEDLLSEVAAFASRLQQPGWSNSLGQKLLQLAGPGVPDIYQGTELWDFSLVDPDNRRRVDFDERRRLLARIADGWLPPVDETGAAKLLVTTRVLRLRRNRPELFHGYRPLWAEGVAARHVVAFARGPAAELVAVATRLSVGLARSGGWRDTLLPLPWGSGRWVDVLSGRAVAPATPPLAELLVDYPVALLLREK
ncbi:malto-oligosyltrehalose synthase [Longimycelium tulufanense]|uniref:Malto-oligosyltrehalose synthase n=1 Tax=Longimycelium tulufanense TaxID=907463 RepID=A0A8J3CDD9_9PSEU|nr:malto-oligosyltrehalose synthase [Longimycelium tulufanense]GGM49711.1 malto-oligosyltrehalose synthase [Longimycelium tulufanense]